ncbi:MAG TPA: YicC/YloC family endoribonuclease [Candidatus Binatia bacterium]|nr:YicC/YloC family endoribonuclease [Candidatus Binatia bacterium]
MSIASMTGFARAEGAIGEFGWTWELKSVNGRNLDVRCRFPAGYEHLDGFVRAKVAEALKRGNLAVTLTIDDAASQGRLAVNREALDQVLGIAAELSGKVAAEPPRLDGLLGLKGVLDLVLPEIDEAETARRTEALQQGFGKAIGGLSEMRRSEGARLAALILAHLQEIERLRTAAAASAGAQPLAIRQKLERQFAELLQGLQPLNEDRLAQEAAVLAGKADVREELDRLAAHVAAARDLIAGGGAVGRKLDFLCQEFNREANTLCSKSADIGLTGIGIELKAAIEQLREQIQNIE